MTPTLKAAVLKLAAQLHEESIGFYEFIEIEGAFFGRREAQDRRPADCTDATGEVVS